MFLICAAILYVRFGKHFTLEHKETGSVAYVTSLKSDNLNDLMEKNSLTTSTRLKWTLETTVSRSNLIGRRANLSLALRNKLENKASAWESIL